MYRSCSFRIFCIHLCQVLEKYDLHRCSFVLPAFSSLLLLFWRSFLLRTLPCLFHCVYYVISFYLCGSVNILLATCSIFLSRAFWFLVVFNTFLKYKFIIIIIIIRIFFFFFFFNRLSPFLTHFWPSVLCTSQWGKIQVQNFVFLTSEGGIYTKFQSGKHVLFYILGNFIFSHFCSQNPGQIWNLVLWKILPKILI